MAQMAQNVPGAAEARIVAVGGGRVGGGDTLRFTLPPGGAAYADAQLDDYGGPPVPGAPRFAHRPGVALSLRARFSHTAGELRGTAGFGFWNAPYGDPTQRRAALPAAIWFFFASATNDLPFAPPPGHGWFAATLDATTPRALALVPLAPAVLALNQFAPLRRRLWPPIRRRLGIHAAPLAVDLRQWHDYRLAWRRDGGRFWVDGAPVLTTLAAPRGPLGFVCWLDNQYLILTPRGRFRAGVLPVAQEQWLEVADLAIEPLPVSQT
jgi:hypothetical protein